MALSIEEVKHIAELARLALTEEEEQLYSEQLSAVLDYAERIQQIATDDVLPLTTVLPLDNVLREDVVEACLPSEKLLSNAPDVEAGMFRVNAVLE